MTAREEALDAILIRMAAPMAYNADVSAVVREAREKARSEILALFAADAGERERLLRDAQSLDFLAGWVDELEGFDDEDTDFDATAKEAARQLREIAARWSAPSSPTGATNG